VSSRLPPSRLLSPLLTVFMAGPLTVNSAEISESCLVLLIFTNTPIVLVRIEGDSRCSELCAGPPKFIRIRALAAKPTRNSPDDFARAFFQMLLAFSPPTVYCDFYRRFSKGYDIQLTTFFHILSLPSDIIKIGSFFFWVLTRMFRPPRRRLLLLTFSLRRRWSCLFLHGPRTLWP